MPMTADNVTKRVLRELFLAPAEQPAEGAHHLIAKEVLFECHAELSARGVANWPVDETPDAAIGPFARYVAAYAAGRLTGIDEEIAKKLNAETERRNIIAATGVRWNGRPPAVDRF